MLKDNLTVLRNIHGFTQEQVAEKLGISRQAYGKWEHGDTVPDIDKCAALAQLYGTTLDALVNFDGGSEERAVPPPPKGKYIFGSVVMNECGQIVIPEAAREVFSLSPGDRLIMLGDLDEGIAMMREEDFVARSRTAMTLAGQDAGE